MIADTKEKPFSCDICSKSFARRWDRSLIEQPREGRLALTNNFALSFQ